MGLLRFLFITILVLWLIRVLIRLLLPLFFQNLANKMQKQASNNGRATNRKPEGSISIEYMPPQAKPGKVDKLGDFVDYEEVK